MKPSELPASQVETIMRTGDVETTCHRCQSTFTCHVDGHQAKMMACRWQDQHCQTCATIAEAEDKARRQEKERKSRADSLRATWEEKCPRLYRESDRSRLPQEIVAAADSWEYGSQGLGFIGESGKGKTRTMFLLLHWLLTDQGYYFQHVTMTEFSLQVATLGCEVEPYIRKLCKTDLLLLDDLGKGKLSEAVQAHLFHIVEKRTCELLPILFTSNAGTAQLAAMLSEDRAAPLLRRLGEFCNVIQV